MTKSKYLHHPKYGHCIACKHMKTPLYEGPCTSCISHRKPSPYWEPEINGELDEILGLKSKKSKYIHHPKYGRCITCEHTNVPGAEEPCISCFNVKIASRFWRWEPEIDKELDEILGLK